MDPPSIFHRRCSTFIIIIIIFISAAGLVTRTESIGINYGQIANNLPSPEKVVSLVKCIGATKVKLYDADPRVLTAFAGTGVEFMVGLGNEFLSKMKDPKQAQAWVKSNIQPYLPATKITSIFVGNEVLTFNDTSLTSNLLPAMQGVHTALVNLGLDKQITVTTTHSLAVLETSYPPSSGAFRSDLAPCLAQILSFQVKTGSPFLINAYPYFAYKANPKQVPLDYVLFQPNQGTVDPGTGLHYDNMLFAQIDAVYAALGRLGCAKVPVHISETGWPLKPDADLNIYVFALFNENQKPGPASERNYGLFKPDGTLAYSLGLSPSSSSSPSPSTNATTGGGGGGRAPPLPPPTSSSGYLSISSAASSLERYCLLGPCLSFLVLLLVELMILRF